MLPTLIGDWGIMNHLNDTQLVCQTLTGFNEAGAMPVCHSDFRLCVIQLGNRMIDGLGLIQEDLVCLWL